MHAAVSWSPCHSRPVREDLARRSFFGSPGKFEAVVGVPPVVRRELEHRVGDEALLDDLSQEVLARLIERYLQRRDPTGPGCSELGHEPASSTGWLCGARRQRVAVNARWTCWPAASGLGRKRSAFTHISSSVSSARHWRAL